jgi:hypothetical protein
MTCSAFAIRPLPSEWVKARAARGSVQQTASDPNGHPPNRMKSRSVRPVRTADLPAAGVQETLLSRSRWWPILDDHDPPTTIRCASVVPRWNGGDDPDEAGARTTSIPGLRGCWPRSRAGRRRPTGWPSWPSAPATTAARLTAALRSTRGWPSCVRCAVTAGWRACVQMRSSRSTARSGQPRCCCSRSRVGSPARSTRPTTCSPTPPRRRSSWERPRR